MRGADPRSAQNDVDVTALAFAQYVSELKSRAASSHNQLHAEMGQVRTAIGTNNSDLQELKRHTAAVQQQMQGEISSLRESLSQVFMEITEGVRKGSEGDHDMKLNFQSLDEQLVQNETRLTQLSESAELSQVQMREFVSELQGQAERVKEELDGLKRFVEETEQRSQERANAISAGVQQLQKDRHVEVERRKDQERANAISAGQVAETLAPLQSDYQEHRAEGTARQNRVQQGIFALEETRRAEESVDFELKQRLHSVSSHLTQTAEQLRQVGESW